MTDSDKGPRSLENYHIDPDFERPSPTAADMFSYWPLNKNDRVSSMEFMAKYGAKFFRITAISDEHPRPPYPNGFWLEGWFDKNAVPLEFGAADEDGVVSPPLTRSAPDGAS